MICKMCLQDKKLVDSHIIPRSFFEHMRPNEAKQEPFEILTNTAGAYNKKSRIGIYDNKLLCSDCEGLLQKYDDYGQKILLKTKIEKQIKHKNSEVLGWEIDDIDYKKLKLFFISILWRSSVSDQTPRCNIGNKFELLLRNNIVNNDIEDDGFDCILSRHDDFLGQNYLLDPISRIRFKNSHVNFANIYLGAGYKLFIKVDQRQIDNDLLKRISFQKGGPLYILKMKDFLQSKEFDVLKSLI